MKTAPIQLIRSHLEQMLGDPLFYRSCPIFLFLRAEGLAVYQQYIAIMNTGRCGNCTERANILRLIDVLVQHIRQQYDNDPAALQCLVDYVGKKLKCTPAPLIITSRVFAGGKLELWPKEGNHGDA